MATEPTFLQSMRKRKTETQFALSIRHVIQSAVPLSVPLGILGEQSQASRPAVEQVKEQCRYRFGRAWTPETYAPPDTQHEPTHTEPPKKPPKVVPPPQRPQSEKRSELLPPPIAGQGGKDHIYLQNLVRGLAVEFGFKAEVEAKVKGGCIDVLLKRGPKLIAVEIAMTTSPSHEMQNVRKCLEAGAQEVWLLSKTKKRLASLKKTAKQELEEEQFKAVRFIQADELNDLLSKIASEPISEGHVRGYKVSVTSSASPDANERRRAIGKVIARTKS